MVRKPSWAALAFVSFLLAGCAGSGAKSDAPSTPSASISATGDPLSDAGSVRVTVVDDTALPIEGATVGIVQLALQVTTDASGTAFFGNLAPGTYQVAATQLGYTSGAKAVAVEADQETGVTLVLAPIIVETPFHETFGPLQGYFECRMGAWAAAYGSWTSGCGSVPVPLVGFTPSPWTNDNSILRFHAVNNNTASVIGDMQWTPSAVGTSTALRFAFSFTGRPSNHWWCAGEGPSPLQWSWHAQGESVCSNVGSSDDEPVPRTHDDDGEPIELRVYANAPFGREDNPVYVTLQQRFEIITTVFYVDPAPEGYSGFGDQ